MAIDFFLLMGGLFWLAVLLGHFFYLRMVFYWTRRTAEGVDRLNKWLEYFSQQRGGGG